jgi:hypothetical protein
MPSSHRRSRPSIDPHGYHPIIVDEDCLTADGCRESLMETLYAIADPERHQAVLDWRSVLTREERREVKRIENAPRRVSPFHMCGYMPDEKEEALYSHGRRGSQRAYARRKYAHGERYWCGDGPPPWKRQNATFSNGSSLGSVAEPSASSCRATDPSIASPLPGARRPG